MSSAYPGGLQGGNINASGQWVQPPSCLTVSDIERLAKAGVAVSFKDIAAQVMPDPPNAVPAEMSNVFNRPQSLVDSFWQRWYRANPPNDNSFGRTFPYEIASATEYGDKVYVVVAPGDTAPFIIEDEKHLYPSDALMAKLHLMEKCK